jgi:hypothetical protein
MFFTINLHSRIFGLGESKHHKDPSDTNLGSRIKAVLLDGMCEIPLCRSDRFLYTVIPGKTKALAGLFTLVRFDLFSPAAAYPRKVEQSVRIGSKRGMSKLL